MTVVTLNANLDPSYYRMEEATGDRALIETFMAKRPSVEERDAAGKALREKVSRASHARYEPSADRPDPVSILEKQNEGRVAKLVPVRFARMLASPFTFLRGSAAVMAERPVGHAGDGHAGRGLRRHARLQLRRLRLGRAQPDLRDQRFRRGPSRAVGMGPQAPGGERRGGRALHGRGQGAGGGGGAGDRALVSQAHPALRRDGLSPGLVRAHRRARRARGALAQAAAQHRAHPGQGARARATSGRWGSSRPRSTASTASSRTCR